MFEKGKSGNPAGRPKKTDTIAGKLNAAGLTDDVIAERLYTGFKSGDEALTKMAVEYAWGKPVQRSEGEMEHYFPENITIEIVKPKDEKEGQAS